MIYLPDVNFWIALNFNRHVHNRIATAWLASVASDQLAFCRITELGLLRLLTNQRVMGTDLHSPTRAWKIYEETRSDLRIVFLSEGAGFTELWRQAANQISPSGNAWTDAYLAVFAHHTNATVVTFDRTFKPIHDCRILTLSSDTP
jgi:toxin-antitoxin system PIN domain toxin